MMMYENSPHVQNNDDLVSHPSELLAHHPIANDFLMKQTPLSHLSPEFGTIEYLLQLSLQSPSATVTQVWSLASPHVTIQFERRTSGLLVLDSWMDAARLQDQNSIADLAQRGYRFPPQGMVFGTGSILIRQSNARTGPRGRRTFEYVLCKIGVGRSYCLEDPNESPTTRPVLPEGYDSLYLHKSEETFSREYPDTKVQSKYYHEYLLLDTAQVLPAFLVQFQYDPDEDEAKKIPVCDSCESRHATRYCKSDNARLCDACDELVHTANKLVSRHIRVPIYEQPQSFGTCPHHPAQGVEFYCPHCQVPVCVHCKMIGAHSAGEAASHKLIPISDAYRQAVGGAERDDPLMDGRKQAIETQMSLLDQRLKEVNSNRDEIEERIYQILREALFQVQQEAQRKLAVLLGEELELRRQAEQIEWLENFLRLQKHTLSPTQFLYAWNRHSQLRSEMHGFSHARAQLDVQADIRLRAVIEVSTEEALRARENEDQWEENPAAMEDDRRMARPPSTPGAIGASEPAPPGNFNLRKTADIWKEELRKKHLGGGPDPTMSMTRDPRNEFSISAEAERRMSVWSGQGLDIQAMAPFATSRILSPSQALVLYFSLPFSTLPGTRLMFSTYNDGCSVHNMHQRCDAVGPTVVVVRVADQVFGGYASMSWTMTQLPFGTSKSFLFSLTKDTKIPFTGARDTCCLFGSANTMSFGRSDLVLKDDLQVCTSEIENSYGIGLPPQSAEARSFLAGENRFEVTALEVWAFTK